MEQVPRCSRCGLDHEHFVIDPRPPPIEMPIPGPSMPRYARDAPAWAVWLVIPAAVLVVTALAILCGALWR